MDIPEQFIKLDAPVPPAPILEDALEYNRKARYIGMYWDGGDEAYVDDGLYSGTQGNWGYMTYVDHPKVALPIVRAGIKRYWLGSSDDEPSHMLVVDREERKLYVAPFDTAQRFLLVQHMPPGQETDQPKPVELTETDFEEVFNQVLTELNPLSQEAEQDIHKRVQKAMEREAEAVGKLANWMGEYHLSEAEFMELFW